MVKYIVADHPSLLLIETNKSLIKIKVNADAVECGDEYHTMKEVYKHRMALFCAFANNYPTTAWKSKFHFDGTMFEGDYFIAGIYQEEGLQITYHLGMFWWDKLKVDTLERAPKYDGHTSNDVVDRLIEYFCK